MLDVNTRKGRLAEQMIRQKLMTIQDKHTFAWFPNSNYFPIDGFLIKENSVIAIFEGKFRQAALQDGKLLYLNRLYDDYLITAQKIDDGVAMAKKMCIDYYLLIALSDSPEILSFKIYDYQTNTIITHIRKNTRTQKTVNGGSAIRENAYIKISEAKVIHTKTV